MSVSAPARLCSDLLARKGTARPAMRASDGAALGWNDNGISFDTSFVQLDHGRALRLRLASAAAGCSMEQLAIDAIDAFLNSMLSGETQ